MYALALHTVDFLRSLRAPDVLINYVIRRGLTSRRRRSGVNISQSFSQPSADCKHYLFSFSEDLEWDGTKDGLLRDLTILEAESAVSPVALRAKRLLQTFCHHQGEF
ncbi:hypothetical protein RRG08_025844 [Elysia crispata]|uniref:Uncharacterized protein n=1 Tax=Elysia crispata TaxID=231223 RepID=A0AAE0Y312_9GAST|nr:hypothetical protein RRG08_025844 [Elysia crispata]